MQALRMQLTYANTMSTLAVVLALGGGVAYAADTIGSSDIIDNEVFSADVRDDTLANGGLGAADLRTDSVRTEEITNNQVRSIDVRNEGLSDGGLNAVDLNPDSVGTSEVDGSLTGNDVTDGSLLGADVEDGSLTGADVTDGSLAAADVEDGSLTGVDVEDDSLTGADVATGSLAGTDVTDGSLAAADVGDGSLTGVDVENGSLLGADVGDNSLFGTDINEATLGIVPNADTLDGLDSARYKNTANTGPGQCNNLGGATTCASAALAGLTAGDDVYLSAWWRWHGDAAGSDFGRCNISRAASELQGTLYGQNGNEHNSNNTSANASLIALDTTPPAGTVTYSLVCEENNGAMSIVAARIVAFRLSG